MQIVARLTSLLSSEITNPEKKSSQKAKVERAALRREIDALQSGAALTPSPQTPNP